LTWRDKKGDRKFKKELKRKETWVSWKSVKSASGQHKIKLPASIMELGERTSKKGILQAK